MEPELEPFQQNEPGLHLDSIDTVDINDDITCNRDDIQGVLVEEYMPANILTCSSGRRKRGRGPTRVLNLLTMPPGKKIRVEFNDMGQPIGDHASKFANLCGATVRNPNYAPLQVEKWKDMPDQAKEMMWKHILAMAKRNKINRSKQKLRHTGGTKSFACYKDEESNCKELSGQPENGSCSSIGDDIYTQQMEGLKTKHSEELLMQREEMQREMHREMQRQREEMQEEMQKKQDEMMELVRRLISGAVVTVDVHAATDLIRSGWTISAAPVKLHEPCLLAMAVAECRFLEAEYDKYATTNASGAAFSHSATLILMTLLLLRHALMLNRFSSFGLMVFYCRATLWLGPSASCSVEGKGRSIRVTWKKDAIDLLLKASGYLEFCARDVLVHIPQDIVVWVFKHVSNMGRN
ncbi:hypothetical protein HHK36_023384 [Tetracentron sinense]|uniref:Uncharacterized protein n=1 Tax=Tetracentron sinense TaxID=13715 RepID=A0A835D8M9_TETSI|nr:hypothetical protein HHK36_023384 [Tetracentron sinense]